MKYVCPLIVVEDLAKSRHFYERILGQQVKFDFGEDVTFEGDFAIHLRAHFGELLGDPSLYPVVYKPHNAELYFETEEIEDDYEQLVRAQSEFIHGIREQPWGQRVLRLYDPDGHIVEIGETMEAVVWRFHKQGLSIDEVCARSSMPRDFVERVVRASGDD